MKDQKIVVLNHLRILLLVVILDHSTYMLTFPLDEILAAVHLLVNLATSKNVLQVLAVTPAKQAITPKNVENVRLLAITPVKQAVTPNMFENVRLLAITPVKQAVTPSRFENVRLLAVTPSISHHIEVKNELVLFLVLVQIHL